MSARWRRTSPRARRGTIVAGFAAILFAGFALASGLDRYSERHLSAERLVPGPFRAQADRSVAALALARGDYARAERAALAALAADPADRRPAALLGAARLLGGDSARAARAFRYSGGLGWREPVTQSYWFDRFVRAGSAERAMDHAAAILRAAPGFAPAWDHLALLEQSTAGRRAILARLSRGAPWARDYLTAFGAEAGVLRRRAEMLAGSDATGLAIGCGPITPMIAELARRNDRAAAERLWLAHCEAAEPQGPLADQDFAGLAGVAEAPPFGWRRQGSGDVSFRAEPNGASGRLLAESRASVTRELVAQPVSLDAGSYVVRGLVSRPGRVLATISCGGPPRPEGAVAVTSAGAAIEGPNCADQVFALWLRPGKGEVAVDAVTLEPR